jgi:hypothetical protein
MLFERIKRGKAFGTLVDVCPDSTFDKTSFAGDTADIWQSRVIASRIQGQARIRQSLIENSSVGVMQGRGECEATASTLVGTELVNGHILGSEVTNSVIHGTGVMIRNSIVAGCNIRGDVAIMNADIEGLELKSKMRLTGTWRRNPRFWLLENEMTSVGITEGLDGTAFVGCRLKPMIRWIKGKDRWIQAGGWPREIGDQLEMLFTQWLDDPIPYA